jgi:transposase
MPRGRPLSEDLRRVIVHMAHVLLLEIDAITNLTMVPRRSVERVLGRYRQTGQVMPNNEVQLRGRRRILEYDDLAVCLLLSL